MCMNISTSGTEFDLANRLYAEGALHAGCNYILDHERCRMIKIMVWANGGVWFVDAIERPISEPALTVFMEEWQRAAMSPSTLHRPEHDTRIIDEARRQ